MELAEAKRLVLRTVDAAKAAGFTVGEDFSVTDHHVYNRAAAAMRQAQAEAFAADLRATVADLVAADDRIAANLISPTAGLGKDHFAESGESDAVEQLMRNAARGTPPATPPRRLPRHPAHRDNPGGPLMAFTDGNPLWRFFYIGGTAMLLGLGTFGFVIGDWFLGGVLAFIGVFLVLARSPLFRLAVTREPDAILCRYVPWYEPGPYVGTLLVLGLGGAGVIAGFRPDFGPVIGVVGAFMLLMLPLGVAKFWRGYRRCRLRITPAALIVPDPARGYAELTIPRRCVLSIAPVKESVGFGSTELVLSEITYSDGAARALRVGPGPADNTVWLTVLPTNLLAALQDWRTADSADPGLLDRLEAVLRSREAAVVAVDHPAAVGVGSGAAGAQVPQLAGSPAAPRRKRRFSGGPLALLLAVSALGAAYPIYRHAHRDVRPEHSVSSVAPTVERPACPVAGAAVVALPTKSASEPTIEVPLASGWVTRDIKDRDFGDAQRGYVDNPSIEGNDSFMDVTLLPSTATGEDAAKKLLTELRATFPAVTSSTDTVCGQTLYRFDATGYNPDGKGARSSTTVFSIVSGKDGSRWTAAAFLNTRHPDDPAYIAQRDALVKGFHVGFA